MRLICTTPRYTITSNSRGEIITNQVTLTSEQLAR